MISRSVAKTQYVVVKFKRNRLDHSEQRCVLRIGICQKHIVILLVLILKHTQPMRTVDFWFDYKIILYGAMFDFADMTENGILCWNIQFIFAFSVHWRLLFKR